MHSFFFLLLFQVSPAVKPEEPAPRSAQLNLLGQTDAASGEGRRNENQQFNLIDTNTVKDMNLRLGTTATVVPEFRADTSYFGSEYGGPPSAGAALGPAPARTSARWELRWAHNNSIASARSFFQVGDVRPARENDIGAKAGVPWKKVFFTFDGRLQRVRGQVNGNVLVPLPSERTPLTNDPALRAIVERYLAGYPAQVPNRADVDPRMLNTNAPQRVGTNAASGRADIPWNTRHRLSLSHSYTAQAVQAFQFVAGQNPDTDIHSNTSRAQWTLTRGASVWSATAGFDRVTTFIRPAGDSLGPTIGVSNFVAGLSPAPPIPILRAQNRFREALQVSGTRGKHNWYAGAEISRNQVNGKEQDGERGILTFANDFGRDAVSNLRSGTPSSFVIALGGTHRGFRNWFGQFYAGDQWRPGSAWQFDYGIRYELATRPVEVNGIDRIPYSCDCNNVAPRLGIAYRLPGNKGRLRMAYGTHFGEIFATTYSQTRLNPPGSVRIAVNQPDLRNPLGGITYATLPPNTRSGFFEVSPHMVTPYAHQYNFSYESSLPGDWRLQLGYVGSRAVKLFQMWFENRARPMAGIPLTTATINSRRPDPSRLEVFRLLNASRAYYDAAKVTVLLPRKHGLTADVSYWFSKALDLGNDYTSTLAGVDARLGRSQAEENVHQDLKARASFDQPHAFIARGTYALPKSRGWELGLVALLKNGTPFNIESGSDAPGFGNVDGQGGDRVDVVDPSVLGRVIGDPDRSMALLPRSAFAFMPPGAPRGNIGRSVFRRGKIANINSSLGKTWKLGGVRALTLRVESINLFNSPQFAEPIKELSSPTFGRIVNTLNDGRTFRAQLRLTL
ncbi:MAG: hypothetical protein JNM66_24825 [Bryobacterales bacterium]|nr:hypothetical protein [Bryobacterales bacterium]